jgi:hypothetical protein
MKDCEFCRDEGRKRKATVLAHPTLDDRAWLCQEHAAPFLAGLWGESDGPDYVAGCVSAGRFHIPSDHPIVREWEALHGPFPRFQG